MPEPYAGKLARTVLRGLTLPGSLIQNSHSETQLLIKKIIYNFFVILISGVTILIYLSLFYFCSSTLFFTIKNWNNLEKGQIVNIQYKQGLEPVEQYTYKVYQIKTGIKVFNAKDEIETNYQIGDNVSFQLKALKESKWIAQESETARIIYVNGKKVGSRINKTEIVMLLFMTLMTVIIYFPISKIIRRKIIRTKKQKY